VAEEIMMPEGTIADFLSRIEGELEALRGRLKHSLDFAEVEQTLTTLVNEVLTALLERVLIPIRRQLSDTIAKVCGTATARGFPLVGANLFACRPVRHIGRINPALVRP
jgi:hypothetical protein